MAQDSVHIIVICHIFILQVHFKPPYRGQMRVKFQKDPQSFKKSCSDIIEGKGNT